MPKDMGTAHGLHQLMRTWLLAEDPYGMNQRTEPTMGTMTPPGAPASGGAVSAPSAPARNPTAQTAGEGAVANALTPASGADALRAQNYGRAAVDRELQKPPTPNVKSEAFQGERNPRAQAQGESAVGQQAVEGALTRAARNKVAKGRLKDPVDPDDRQPD